MFRKLLISLAVVSVIAVAALQGWRWYQAQQYPNPPWTNKERLTIASLWLGNLHDLPADPSNDVADNPDAARLGQQLFFDTRFSGNGEVSCASCHDPTKHFTDGKPLAVGMGITSRSSPTIVGTAYHPFIFWDGRADSHWAQALGPMENAVEHGGSRMQFAHLVASDPAYRAAYEALFGPLPDLSDPERFPQQAGPVDKQSHPAVHGAWQAMSETDQKLVTRIYTNLGKAIAAYERLMQPAPARFDTYAGAIENNTDDGLEVLSRDEVEGLRLFIGKGRCIECHNGPLFSNNDFANIATPPLEGKPYDFGRSRGVMDVISSEFNCTGDYSDAEDHECGELRFIKRVGDELVGGFKVPGLRNVTATAPYMHAGQMADLDAVMDHYNKAPAPPFGHSMLTKLDLEPEQLQQLVAFLHTLDSGIDVAPEWLQPPTQ